MDEYINKIEEYILYREKMKYKKTLGYSLSNTEKKQLDILKEEAIKASYYIEEENKRLKKLIKSIK
jgi:hypothetical protein